MLLFPVISPYVQSHIQGVKFFKIYNKMLLFLELLDLKYRYTSLFAILDICDFDLSRSDFLTASSVAFAVIRVCFFRLDVLLRLDALFKSPGTLLSSKVLNSLADGNLFSCANSFGIQEQHYISANYDFILIPMAFYVRVIILFLRCLRVICAQVTTSYDFILIPKAFQMWVIILFPSLFDFNLSF